ncbi:MAG: hypothetical protein K2X93_22865 [Candidatus Obscuribacterales bacterium]|nr:hypothetical protein [Candidatus Obscuribacterales bacterium]
MVEKDTSLESASSALDARYNGLFNIANLNFDFFDQDKNGKIQRKEIFKAISSDEVKGDDAVALATSRRNFKEIRDLEKGDGEKRDITKDDLKKLAEFGHLKAMKVIAGGSPIFRALDTNSDDKLSKEELEQSLPKLKDGTTKKAVQAMLKDFEIIGGKGATEITATQVKEYVAKRMSDNEEGSVDKIATNFSETKKKLDESNRKTYSEDKPYWSVQGEAPKQGRVGDCWLIAAMSSMFEKDPRAVEKMIRDNGNGTLTVTFPYKYEGKELQATIPKPTDTELSLYASTGKFGTYGAIMEKALGKIMEERPELKEKLTGAARNRGKGVPVQELLNGSSTPFGIELLTGESAKTLSIRDLDAEELHYILSFSGKDASTCDADGDWPKRAGDYPERGHSTIRRIDLIELVKPKGTGSSPSESTMTPKKTGKTRPGGSDSPGSSDRAVKPDSQVKSIDEKKPSRPDGTGTGDNTSSPAVPSKPDRPDRPDKPDVVPDKPDKPSQPDKPDRPDKPDKPDAVPEPKPRPEIDFPLFPKPRPWQEIDEDEDEKEEPRGFSAHEFSILKYDAERRVVTIRNPWGSGELTGPDDKAADGKDDGIMEMPLAEFVKYFRNVSFSQSVIDRGKRAYQESKKH